MSCSRERLVSGMSSPTPAQRATAARRLDYAMRDLELCHDNNGGPATLAANVRVLRIEVDKAIELLSNG